MKAQLCALVSFLPRREREMERENKKKKVRQIDSKL